MSLTPLSAFLYSHYPIPSPASLTLFLPFPSSSLQVWEAEEDGGHTVGVKQSWRQEDNLESQVVTEAPRLGSASSPSPFPFSQPLSRIPRRLITLLCTCDLPLYDVDLVPISPFRLINFLFLFLCLCLNLFLRPRLIVTSPFLCLQAAMTGRNQDEYIV